MPSACLPRQEKRVLGKAEEPTQFLHQTPYLDASPTLPSSIHSLIPSSVGFVVSGAHTSLDCQGRSTAVTTTTKKKKG